MEAALPITESQLKSDGILSSARCEDTKYGVPPFSRDYRENQNPACPKDIPIARQDRKRQPVGLARSRGRVGDARDPISWL